MNQKKREYSNSMETIENIQIYPVPDNLLEKVENNIAESSVEFIKRIYPHI